jgi:hypothetical protein
MITIINNVIRAATCIHKAGGEVGGGRGVTIQLAKRCSLGLSENC